MIKGLLNKIKTPKNKAQLADETFLKSETIYNGEYNFIILISFTKEYFIDAMEFLSIPKEMVAKFINSSYRECITDSDGKDKFIDHERYYIITAGRDDEYTSLFTGCWNTVNTILSTIGREIRQHRATSSYKELITDYIFSENDFKYNNLKPEYDDRIVLGRCRCDNAEVIRSKLPSTVNGRDMLEIIRCYVEYEYYTLLDVIHQHLRNFDAVYRDLEPAIKVCIKNTTENVLMNIAGAKYKIMDDEVLPGDVSDESLDEIFRQRYDRFNAITPDSDVEYESIDEIIAYGEDDNITEDEE